MKKTLFVILAGAVGVPAFAADSYTVDPRHTFPSFEINHLGFSTQRGRFNKTSGKITLDRQARTGTVEIVIDTASVNTGLDKLEEHLRSDEFFDVARHPTMTFKSTSVKFASEKISAVEGELTLLGVTRPVTLTVNAFNCGVNPINKKEACGADATTTIKRSDFGMTKFLPALGDEVKLSINVEAFKD